MKPYIIVGGGLSGLLAANYLKRSGIEFIGLESSDALGGRARTGHHRIYQESSVTYLSEQLETPEWEKVDDLPQERFKGNFRPLTLQYSPAEKFYLEAPFFSPKPGFDLVEALSQSLGPDAFRLNQTVVSILPKTKRLLCQEDAELEYEKIIWTSPLSLLAKVWKGDTQPLAKLYSKKSEIEKGGINLEIEVELSKTQLSELFPQKNTTVFSFRFKDHNLRMLGVPQEGDTTQRIHWLVFLPKSILENREEVAKCVRTFKRELFKEFPQLKEASLSEKISFLPQISCDFQSKTKSLELLPDLFYVGPQVYEADTEKELQNIDRVVANCRALENKLAEAQI